MNPPSIIRNRESKIQNPRCRSGSVLTLLGVALLAVLAAGQGPAASTPPPITPETVWFTYVDVWIDPGGQGLAAYQLDLSAAPGGTVPGGAASGNAGAGNAAPGTARIVGIEGGEHPGYADPPYYDPAAMQQDRVVLAAFCLDRDLPSGPTRVARIHVMITGEAPQWAATLTVAAAADATPLAATVTAVQGE